MWTDLQAFLVFALGDALLVGGGVFIAACFGLALLTATAWAIRNLRP